MLIISVLFFNCLKDNKLKKEVFVSGYALINRFYFPYAGLLNSIIPRVASHFIPAHSTH